MFFSAADGRVIRQENYDCYEPLPVFGEGSAAPAGTPSRRDPPNFRKEGIDIGRVEASRQDQEQDR